MKRLGPRRGRSHVDPLPLAVAQIGIGDGVESGDSVRHCHRRQQVVAVQEMDEVALRRARPKLRALARRRCPLDQSHPVAERRNAGGTSSVEPSSTTRISIGRQLWSMQLRTASTSGPARLYTGSEHGHERAELLPIGRNAVAQHAGVVAPPRALGRASVAAWHRIPAGPHATAAPGRRVGANQRIGPLLRSAMQVTETARKRARRIHSPDPRCPERLAPTICEGRSPIWNWFGRDVVH